MKCVINAKIAQNFSKLLLNWYEENGRKNLPWQQPQSAYQVWISEIMLQQTQVTTVIPYFLRFMQSFPTIKSLALASDDRVLAHWAGLGYYSRARNLHQTAKIVVNEYSGILPNSVELLKNLPGIGTSTAAAITAQAFNQPTAILDANVKRVLSRCFTVGAPLSLSKINSTLWQIADACMPQESCREYTQAIMDLGALCCTSRKPQCQYCPLQNICKAYAQDQIKEYPYKPAKKAKPTRHQKFLICHQQGNVFLEKRPPVGIWGGLWCLPSIDAEINPFTHLSEHYQFSSTNSVNLTNLKHSFSHFHLEIEALCFEITKFPLKLANDTARWVSINDYTELGLSVPVTLILKKFFQEFMTCESPKELTSFRSNVD